MRRVDVRCQEVLLFPYFGFFIARLATSQDDAVNAVVTRKGRVVGPVGRDTEALVLRSRLAGTVTREVLGLASKGDVMSKELAEHHGHVSQFLRPLFDIFEYVKRDGPGVRETAVPHSFAWFALAVGVIGRQQAAKGSQRCSPEGVPQVVAYAIQCPKRVMGVALRRLHFFARFHFLGVSRPHRGEDTKNSGPKKDVDKSGELISDCTLGV